MLCLSLQQRHINTRHLLQQLDAVLRATICRLSQILCWTERDKHFSYFSVKTLVLSRCRLLQLLQAQICMWLKVFTSFLKVWQLNTESMLLTRVLEWKTNKTCGGNEVCWRDASSPSDRLSFLPLPNYAFYICLLKIDA